MANELNIALAKSGLTVTAQRYQAGAAVGSAISCPETGSSGFYSGNMTGTAGTYQVAFLAAGANVGSGSIVWDGTNEVASSAPSAAQNAAAVWSQATRTVTGGTVDTLTNAPTVPSAAAIASQVRTELSTELGRLDATVSSRLAPSGTLATVTTLTNAPTVPTAAAIADEVRVELATELARIDAPISGAGNAPSAATVAAAVRSELSTELARVDAAVSTRLASSAYTAPANSDVAAIKAKTDALNTERLANVATTAIVGNLIAQANS